MKSKLIKLAFLSILSIGSFSTLTSCVDNDLNIDPKHPSVVPSENLLGTSLYQYAYYVSTPSVNYNNYNFFVQQWAETTYADETKYNLVTRNQPRNHFNRMYVYVINNIKSAKSFLPEEVNTDVVAKNKLASLEILEILAWENLVNTFGNIPYSDAFKAKSERNFTPTYDDAKTIYVDLINRLDTVISTIDISEKGYSSGDFVYYGDMQKWKETANAIKLRLGINLSDTDPTLAKSTIESAVTSGIYQSDAESFSFAFDGGTFTNPIFDNLVASGRKDFVPSELLINTMNTNSDPRLSKWFTTISGVYKGGDFGYQNAYGSYSHMGKFFETSTTPVKLVSYTEISFLLAEAAQRGFSVGGSAESYYEQAVKSSMTESGVSDADATTYLAANPYSSTEWKKTIGTQAWVALFTRAYPGWNFTRRLDYPVLTNPKSSLINTVPYRMPYSDQEFVLNKTNVEAASTAIGGNSASTKLFWDVN
ncbi:SusD/RagB family nutrient-binding outer membrane lipoprotein [Chishuiella sp.]|uniref:SusD/RagB family nutrient-binding outer membrane lipoprotein n=1 Tax=Chishuiella sp. TaxID=1969467 RepID=UPI0028AEC072|nr:SusD/RagB family nutrient-binding outer membrane lipoprotein [Chishuiella sp.]